MKWSDDKHNFFIDLVKKHGRSWKRIANIMTSKYDHVYTSEQCRSRWRTNRHKIDNSDPVAEYGVKKKRNADGTLTLEQLIEVYSENDLKDDKFILKANGFDPHAWILKDLEYSMWGHLNKELPKPVTLYANKIKVSPKEDTISYGELIEKITEKTKPIKANDIKYKVKDKRMLEISLMDMHFGVNTFDDYKGTLARIKYHLERNVWQRIIITFGSDLLHVDNLKNTTANGTRIQDVDVLQMIDDAKRFYEHLITIATKQANEVKVIYVKGNHDETTSGLLVHWLQARFPDVEVDTSIEEVKVETWEQIFVALTHGDKGGKRTKNTLSTRYPVEWANSVIRELHKGHEHHEKVIDEFGITERTLSTGAKTDQYHRDNSYEGAHKRFQIFEYSHDWLESIHYV